MVTFVADLPNIRSGSKHFGGSASASRSSRVTLGENKLKLNESVTEQGTGGFTGNYSELKDVSLV